MWKNTVEPDSPQMAIWCMWTAHRITKTKNTHLEYVTIIAFALQQWLHERASMLCVHCLSHCSLYTFWHGLHKELFMAGKIIYFSNYQQMAETTGNLKTEVTACHTSYERYRVVGTCCLKFELVTHV